MRMCLMTWVFLAAITATVRAQDPNRPIDTYNKINSNWGAPLDIEDDYFTGLRGYAMSQHHGAGKNFWDCFMVSQAELYVCSHNPQTPTGSGLLNADCTVMGDGVSRCSVITDISPAIVAWFHWDDSNPNIIYYELPGVDGFSDAQELGRCDLQAQSCWFYQ